MSMASTLLLDVLEEVFFLAALASLSGADAGDTAVTSSHVAQTVLELGRVCVHWNRASRVESLWRRLYDSRKWRWTEKFNDVVQPIIDGVSAPIALPSLRLIQLSFPSWMSLFKSRHLDAVETGSRVRNEIARVLKASRKLAEISSGSTLEREDTSSEDRLSEDTLAQEELSFNRPCPVERVLTLEAAIAARLPLDLVEALLVMNGQGPSALDEHHIFRDTSHPPSSQRRALGRVRSALRNRDCKYRFLGADEIESVTLRGERPGGEELDWLLPGDEGEEEDPIADLVGSADEEGQKLRSCKWAPIFVARDTWIDKAIKFVDLEEGPKRGRIFHLNVVHLLEGSSDMWETCSSSLVRFLEKSADAAEKELAEQELRSALVLRRARVSPSAQDALDLHNHEEEEEDLDGQGEMFHAM
ncbi:hypothetical protein M427DRAFT_58353 [Gonapodya prolifera JEL478]|uniref:F-box domain-containing protein n=1 Tax=Gonapodya prolifera (strain JEL478) TaxID=1344416 RepID=A0A139AAI9_GONPJ|nr:hypothetical protein M427DRAFT_58353 [Gonapodya prolifera JEL478]|eukprot:KXS13760.1 hypothetical protein M427DRAFT_58353 [Gonapodya prolifera JEL478]